MLSISDPGVIANVDRALVLIWPRSRSSSGKRYLPAIDHEPFRRPQPCLNFTDRLSCFDSRGVCDSTNDALLQWLPVLAEEQGHLLSQAGGATASRPCGRACLAHIGFALVPLTEREKFKPLAGQVCVGVTATEALPPTQVQVPPSARSLRVRLWLMLPRKDPGNCPVSTT